MRSVLPLAALSLLAGCFDFARLSAGGPPDLACSAVGCVCATDNDCANVAGTVCSGGSCQPGCDEEVPCVAGQTCCGGACQEGPGCAGGGDGPGADLALSVDGALDAGQDAALDARSDGGGALPDLVSTCGGDAGCACSQSIACGTGTLCCATSTGAFCRFGGGSACSGTCTTGTCCTDGDCATNQTCAADHTCHARCGATTPCGGGLRCCGGLCYGGACTTTLAGSGLAGPSDAPASSTSFGGLTAIAVDPSGPIYVSDLRGPALRVLNLGTKPLGPTQIPVGSVGRLTGRFGCRPGPLPNAEVQAIFGMARDGQGNLYLADAGCGVVWKVAADLSALSLLAGNRSSHVTADGVGAAAGFVEPMGITFAPDGNLYVTDFGAHLIRRVTLAGAVTTVAGNGQQGHIDGPAPGTLFFQPGSIASDAAGVLYVGEWGNADVRKITGVGTAGAQVATLTQNIAASYGGSTVIGATPWLVAWNQGPTSLVGGGSMATPMALSPSTLAGSWSLIADAAINPTGLWVGGWVEGGGPRANTLGHIDLTGKVLASYGTPNHVVVVDGAPDAATFDTAGCGGGLASFSGGLVVTDRCGQRLRHVSLTDGSVSSWGAGVLGEMAGGPSLFELCSPSAPVALGGALYTFEFGCGFRVGRVDPSGTLAFAGTLCATGGTPCYYPSMFGHGAADAQGNLYVPIQQESTPSGAAPLSPLIVRVPASGGAATIVAGSSQKTAQKASDCVDGAPGTAVLGTFPYDLAIDTQGTLWFADPVCGVRKVANGVVVTVVPALASVGLAIGPGPSGAETLFVSATNAATISTVDRATGKATLYAGGSVSFDAHDVDGPNASARFWEPWSLTVDSGGVLYVLDMLNAKVRAVYP